MTGKQQNSGGIMKGWLALKRGAIYTTGTILATVALLTIAALTPRQWGKLPVREDCRYTVYVSGDAMHTNLIIPVKNEIFDWHQHLNLQQIGARPAHRYGYLQFGWGDRIFYVETPSWDQLSIRSALRALFLQNPAAMFMKGHVDVPKFPNEELKCVRLGAADYLALMQFVEASFQRDAQGRTLLLKGEAEAGFYAATGKYSLLRTCNSWVADGLRTAHVNTPVWGGLAPAVMRQVKNGCDCQTLP